jgi:hypothetical protein
MHSNKFITTIAPTAAGAILFLSFSSAVYAVSPAPDGGYPGNNTAEGTDALFNLNTAGAMNNTGIGASALYQCVNTSNNTAVGAFAIQTGQPDYDTAVGAFALNSDSFGSNTAVGYSALMQNTSGGDNTAIGDMALFSNTAGNNNTAIGFFALEMNNGENNTAIGYLALQNNSNGVQDTATGVNALASNTSGNDNTADGVDALNLNTTGFSNTAVGSGALSNCTTGNNNVAIGWLAGSGYATGSNNIHIGHEGVNTDTATIRIGTAGTHRKTYIAGIYGATASGGIPVYINNSGKLGTATSSARFKENIRQMGEASDVLLSLRPVTFRYKEELDPEKVPQFGLVAEEVEKVAPDLVVRDSDGKPYTVRYDAVNAMLLNELLKEHRKVEEQSKTIAELRSTIAQHAKGMEALAAQLKKQSAQIQRVSAELAASKPTAQLVDNR